MCSSDLSSQKTGSAISRRSAEAGVFTGGFRELGNLVRQLRTQKTKQSVTDLTQNTSVNYIYFVHMKKESQAKKNFSPKELKSFSELKNAGHEKLPQTLIYVSLDSYEFDLITDFYKEKFRKSGEVFETVIFVAENGDMEKLFSEVFSFSMFASSKLIIIWSGEDFFKTILSAGKKDLFENFRKNVPNIPDTYYILVHYDAKDIPAKMNQLFSGNFSVIRNKQLYPEERKRVLEEILKSEKITLDADALDEFMQRIPSNSGAYLRNILKVRALLEPKKHFTKEDMENTLFAVSEINPFQLADSFFSVNQAEFFKEFGKLQKTQEDRQGKFLSLLSIFLNRADEIRKAKTLLKAFRNDSDEKEFFRLLGMEHFSEGRKRFVKGRLRRESTVFSDQVLEKIYDMLYEINFKMKTGLAQDLELGLFISRSEEIFLMLKRG